jgi:ABC-type amino acid transport substrate-binding protein
MNNLVPEQVFVTPPSEFPSLPAHQNRLRIIEQRGSLRACYWSDNLPFAYFNKADDLVGFDIELLHHLAYDLKVELVLVPAARRELTRDLNRGYCDIGIGTLITPANALKAGFSVPYINLTGAFLVRDHRRGDFSSREAMQQLEAPRIAMVPQRYYAAKLRGHLPQAEMVEVTSTRDFIENWSDRLDAMVTTAEGAAAWSLLHPQFSAVIPASDTIRLPVAFPLPKDEEGLEDFLKIWIDLKNKDGTIDDLYGYWVLGKQDKHRQPRWSVIRDVLHWVE